MKLYLLMLLASLAFNSYGAAQNANQAHQMFKVPEILINIASKCFYIEDLDLIVGKMVTANSDLKYYIYSDGLKIFSSYLECKFGKEFDSAKFLFEACDTKSDSYLKYIEPLMYIIKNKNLKSLQALLIYCVFKNDLDLVHEFIKSKQNNNDYIPKKYNPIDLVKDITMGIDIEYNKKQLDFLFKIGYINFVERYYGGNITVLHKAYSDLDLMSFIINAGLNFKYIKGKISDDLFIDLFGNGLIDECELFLKAGFDPNYMFDIELLKGYDSLGYDSIEFLIKKGFDVNTVDGCDESLLAKMSSLDDGDSVRLLLEAGANPNITSDFGSALMCASRLGNENMVKMLLDKNADIDLQQNSKGYGNDCEYETCKYEGSDDQIIIASGDTALMTSCRYGQINIVKLLIERGANLNIQNCNGDTALTLARKNGHIDIVKLLSDAGAQ